MSVRKREWTTAKGEAKSAWVVDYVDQSGRRHIKTFAKKKVADAFEAQAKVDVRAGVHTPDSASITVAEAAGLWLETCELEGLERSTIADYRALFERHIRPMLGRTKLSKINPAALRAFKDVLMAGAPIPGETEDKKRSASMVKHVMAAFSALLSDAHERGLIAVNPAKQLSGRRKRRAAHVEARQRRKLKVGVDIPSPDEIQKIIGALPQIASRYRVMILAFTFTGARSSELRGLKWADVDFEKRELHIRQRADRYGEIGAPKSETSERVIPCPPMLTTAFRQWWLECGRDTGLVFGTKNGAPDSHSNVVQRGFHPAQVAAGVVNEIGAPKYGGLHSLRHFFASWSLGAKSMGGLGLPLKVVSERMGHTTIVLTSDTYAHLLPRSDEHDRELAEAEARLWTVAT